jgi:hypothetical protein
MDKGFERLGQIKGLLSQALGVAVHNMQNNRSVDEAKSHIRQAINSVDKATKKQMRKRQVTESQFETWWGHIQSGTANAAMAPMSAEAHAKSLAELNNMIETEESKLKDLEDSQTQSPDQLLRD